MPLLCYAYVAFRVAITRYRYVVVALVMPLFVLRYDERCCGAVVTFTRCLMTCWNVVYVRWVWLR